MACQHSRLNLQDRQEGQEIVAEVVPPGAILDERGQGGRSMTTLVDRQDPVALRQRRQDSPIRVGVEAVGMQEEKVGGSIRRSEIEDRQDTLAPPGQSLESPSEV